MQIKYTHIASSKSSNNDFETDNTTPSAKRRKVQQPEFCVLKCSKDDVGIVRASLTFLTQIGGKRVYARVINVSGSPRTAKMATIKYWRNLFGSSSSSSAYMEDVILPSIK